VALAVFDAKKAREKSDPEEEWIPEVKERHLSQVVSMSKAFKEYITLTHEGYEDADWAYMQGIRNDRKDVGNVKPKAKATTMTTIAGASAK
jgi:hypothetical protein